MKDIETTKDIEQLVNSFYALVRKSPIGYFFDEIAQVDWEDHLAKLNSFWSMNLLGIGEYNGNAMLPHLLLHQKESFKPEHFQTWLKLWKSNIDAQFEGRTAEKAKKRGEMIASVMEFKIQNMPKR